MPSAFPLPWKGRRVPLLGIQKLAPTETMGDGQHPDVRMDALTRSLLLCNKGENTWSVPFIPEELLIATCARDLSGASKLTWKYEV